VAARVEATPGYQLTVDLEAERIAGPDGFTAPIAVDPLTRQRLLAGLDDIALILQHEAAIRRYEAAHLRV
jgi:3-isopropylmalate/(R)-2-methylmalate dehydratase small subunit